MKDYFSGEPARQGHELDELPDYRGPAHRQHRVDLAGIAADTGYCDQAHLTREFVRFAGVPPRLWLAEEFRNIQDGAYAYRSESRHDQFEPDRLVDPASP